MSWWPSDMVCTRLICGRGQAVQLRYYCECVFTVHSVHALCTDVSRKIDWRGQSSHGRKSLAPSGYTLSLVSWSALFHPRMQAVWHICKYVEWDVKPYCIYLSITMCHQLWQPIANLKMCVYVCVSVCLDNSFLLFGDVKAVLLLQRAVVKLGFSLWVDRHKLCKCDIINPLNSALPRTVSDPLLLGHGAIRIVSAWLLLTGFPACQHYVP